MLAFGFMNHEKAVLVDNLKDQMEVIDKYAITYNNYLESCRLYGIVLFILGGLIISITLILPSFMCYSCLYKDCIFENATSSDNKPSFESVYKLLFFFYRSF